jgi:hypothetical protein
VSGQQLQLTIEKQGASAPTWTLQFFRVGFSARFGQFLAMFP